MLFLSRRLLIARFLRRIGIVVLPSRQSKLGEFVVGERDRIVRSSARRVFVSTRIVNACSNIESERVRNAAFVQAVAIDAVFVADITLRLIDEGNPRRRVPGTYVIGRFALPRPPCGRALDHVASTLARAHRGLFGVFAGNASLILVEALVEIADESAREVARVEIAQVVDPLADADLDDGQLELVGYR